MKKYVIGLGLGVEENKLVAIAWNWSDMPMKQLLNRKILTYLF